MSKQTLSRRRAKAVRSLTRKKYRKKLQQFIVEGRRAVASAVEAQAPIVDVIVSESAREDDQVERLLEQINVPVWTCSDERLEKLSDVETSQGLLAVVKTQFHLVEELKASASLLALDGVQDPGNAGTLMRTAAWFGVDAVVAGSGTVDLVNPKVVRAAMGAHWDLKVATVGALDQMLQQFRTYGFTPYAADLSGQPVDRWTPARPSILVMGSEAHGLSSAVRAQIDQRIYVNRPSAQPGAAGGVESLNVAVASGIILYHWLR